MKRKIKIAFQITVAVLIFYAIISLVTILIVDLAYGVIDPRVRIGGGN